MADQRVLAGPVLRLQHEQRAVRVPVAERLPVGDDDRADCGDVVRRRRGRGRLGGRLGRRRGHGRSWGCRHGGVGGRTGRRNLRRGGHHGGGDCRRVGRWSGIPAARCKGDHHGPHCEHSEATPHNVHGEDGTRRTCGDAPIPAGVPGQPRLVLDGGGLLLVEDLDHGRVPDLDDPAVAVVAEVEKDVTVMPVDRASGVLRTRT